MVKKIEEKILYDKERDTSYIICRKCGEKVDMDGTFEYGFYFDCECGYSFVVPEK